MSPSVLGIVSFLLVAAVAALWFRKALRVELPENRSGFVAVWLAGAVLGVVALSQGPGWVGGVPALLAALAGGFLCFTVGISRQKVGEGGIRVGATLPGFSAPDENGETFQLSSLGGKPLLLKFFRGHW